ncbi:hypothetical protein [Desulfosporosinus hippei]|uniref:Uncharacterized protein n=1 Tax=Desulfosporosinus hippei DSM 8344 TaxID=1121419 RepID=A0A1G8CGQ3_9FIRM|nr:hypothetical protein [Desulfosporosinus hippei]SDH44615.1 hypothetical protein SAMN05443529_11396 [Desulfosporosinus hippei DSM 8344]
MLWWQEAENFYVSKVNSLDPNDPDYGWKLMMIEDELNEMIRDISPYSQSTRGYNEDY